MSSYTDDELWKRDLLEFKLSHDFGSFPFGQFVGVGSFVACAGSKLVVLLFWRRGRHGAADRIEGARSASRSTPGTRRARGRRQRPMSQHVSVTWPRRRVWGGLGRVLPSASTCSVEGKTSGTSACRTYGLSELFAVNLTLRSFAPVAAEPGFELYATSQ